MYPGDLLGAVLRVDKAYWLANVGQWRGRGHRKRARSAYEELRDSLGLDPGVVAVASIKATNVVVEVPE